MSVHDGTPRFQIWKSLSWSALLLVLLGAYIRYAVFPLLIYLAWAKVFSREEEIAALFFAFFGLGLVGVPLLLGWVGRVLFRSSDPLIGDDDAAVDWRRLHRQKWFEFWGGPNAWLGRRIGAMTAAEYRVRERRGEIAHALFALAVAFAVPAALLTKEFKWLVAVPVIMVGASFWVWLFPVWGQRKASRRD